MHHRLFTMLDRVSRAALFAATAATLTIAPVGSAQATGTQRTPDAGPGPREYTILIFESDAQLATRTSPTSRDAYWDAYDRFAGELAQAGVLRGGSALDEQTRMTVRGTGSADGAVPRARLGGYFVIAVRDSAAAVAWARKAPPLALAVEVRPHRPNPHMAAASPAGTR